MAVSESVELDLGPALAAVDDLGSALDATLSSFTSSAADALASLSPATVEILADTASLTSSIDDGAAAATPTATVTADAASITGAVEDAAAAAEPVATVQADTAEMVSSIETAADNIDISIPVNADTTSAQDSIDSLSQSADDGSASLGDLSSGLGSVVTGGGAAAASLSGVSSSLESVGSSAGGPVGAAIAGFAGLTAASDQLFQSSVRTQAGQQRFNQTFGEFADDVQHVDIGSLDTSLSNLNTTLGSSTTQTKNALSNFGQLGDAAGASKFAVALTSEEIAVLSARAVALNPALGSVGDVAEKMGAALSRGGRFASQFGISLSAGDIQARALRDNVGKTADQLTTYDKAAAGAALATEKYGSSLDSAITAGSESPLIQLRKIGAEFASLTSSLGQPLVAPIFDIIRSAQPILSSVARLVGTLLQALLPVADALFAAFQPLVSGVFQTLGSVVATQVPLFQSLATIITNLLGPALSSLQPAFDGIVQLAMSMQTALQPLIREAIPLSKLFGESLGVLAQGAALAIGAVADVASRLVDFLAPILTLAMPLAAITDQLGITHGEFDKFSKDTGGFKGHITATVTTLDDLRAKLDETNKSFADTIVTKSKFADDPTMLDSLRRTGISMQDLQKDLGGLDTGLKDFTARAIAAGQVKITLNGADVSADQVRNLKGTLTDYLNTSGAVVVQGGALVNTFIAQGTATEQQSEANFKAIASTQALTDEQIRAIGVQAQQQFGVDSYTTRLQVLAAQQDTVTQQLGSSAGSLTGNASAWVALTQAVADGTINIGNAQQAAGLLGVDANTATKFIQDAQSAVDNFVSNALSKFPTVTSVFNDMKTAADPLDPKSLTNSLNLATIAGLNFQSNVDLIAQKFPEVAQLLRDEGPQAAGAFAQTFLGASDEVKQGLEDSINANKAALGTISDDLRQSIGANVKTASDLASQMTDGFDQNLNFAEATTLGVAAAKDVLLDHGVIDPPRQQAGFVGGDIGFLLGQGIASGMGSTSPLLEQVARETINRIKAAMEDEADVHSPSRVFAEIGSNLSAGLASGISGESAAVVAAAEAIVRDAARAAGAGTLGIPATTLNPAGGVTGANASGGNVLSVTIPVSVQPGATAEEGKAVGEAVADAFMSNIDVEAFIS